MRHHTEETPNALSAHVHQETSTNRIDVSHAMVAVGPVVLSARGRGDDLRIRVSAPTTGDELAVIVFSHGHGSSVHGYGPLVDHWAANGFVVIQPTHLDSRTLQLADDDPRRPDIWRTRVDDLKRCLDDLELIEAAVPGLAGRVDRSRVAAAGHSWGGHTVSQLLGARVLDSDGNPGPDLSDPRITAGVLLAAPGRGGTDLTPFAAEHLPFMNVSFTDMTTPALVVAGDRDDPALSDRGPDWTTDAYTSNPDGKFLLTLFGAEHSLGGIAGYEAAETTDENPERVAELQRLTVAYLRSALDPGNTSWDDARVALSDADDPIGRIDSNGHHPTHHPAESSVS